MTADSVGASLDSVRLQAIDPTKLAGVTLSGLAGNDQLLGSIGNDTISARDNASAWIARATLPASTVRRCSCDTVRTDRPFMSRPVIHLDHDDI